MSITTTPAVTNESLDLRADMAFKARNRLALRDLSEGIKLWPLAWKLGWLDIKLRYRGSMLGPFWLTLSTGAMVAGLGLLYSTLFKLDVHDYLPFISLSIVLWGFLSTMVSESCAAFTEAEAIIRSVRMPFFVFSIRTVIRNILVLAHNIVVVVIVFAIFRLWPGWNGLYLIPALAVWIINSLALTLLLGGFCTRFRDIQPIVNSVMQIAFFMTPVIWKPEQLGPRVFMLAANPFYDMLEIVRAPLLGTSPGAIVWLATMAYSVALLAIAWAFFVHARRRVAFWL
jgi:lipopolysaccharide transport system permease protein